MPKVNETERNEAIAMLKRIGVKPGATLYTSVTHVSSSGMSRRVRVYVVSKGVIEDITGMVARVLGSRRAPNNGWDIVMGGCGYDVGFDVVYNLGRVMFPKGARKFVLHTREHQAALAGDTSKGERDGGYLLKHRAL
jgi:hypothetical protein